jgi:hypothetical protein
MLGVDSHGQLDGVCMDSTATCMQGVASHGQLDGVKAYRACMHHVMTVVLLSGEATKLHLAEVLQRDHIVFPAPTVATIVTTFLAYRAILNLVVINSIQTKKNTHISILEILESINNLTKKSCILIYR